MVRILRLIYSHPFNRNNKLGAVIRFIKWQLSSRLWGGSFVFNWINDAKLIISNGMTGATGNIYVGLMEYEDMSFLLHYIQQDDLFFDVGANVGVYTILASKVRGARTVSIEPLPITYSKLIDNIQINKLKNVTCKNIGLSFEKSKLFFTSSKDTMNRVALIDDDDRQLVLVDTLDSLCQDYGVPKIIKIDVEGYETNVLKGAQSILSDDNLEVIIIELNGSGDKFGFNDKDIHEDLLKAGFLSYSYAPFERRIIKLNSYGTHNTIYIKTKAFEKIKNLVKNSEKFECNGIHV